MAETFEAKGGYETPIDVSKAFIWETIPANIELTEREKQGVEDAVIESVSQVAKTVPSQGDMVLDEPEWMVNEKGEEYKVKVEWEFGFEHDLLPEEYRGETFEAKGYKGISASKIQVLEKYIQNGGKALDYHELPYHTQRQLEMGRVHELLYQDVNRWLQDNAPNPHHAMPSWLSAEEGKVRTMSGKPHTPRKLRKDQNIKPEEARMRKQMKAESTPFAEGRMAARTMFTPERTSEDYHSGVDTEYMIAYGISPDELMEDVDSNRTRYLQFLAGWDDGWNYSFLVANKVIEDEDDFPYDYLYEDLDMTTDYEFAGEYVSMKHKGQKLPQIFDEYIPEKEEVLKSLGIMVGAGLLAVLGMKGYERMKRGAETFRATTPCSTDDDCPEGQVCVDGECLPICEDDGDCASWRECRDDLHPTERVCGEDKTDSIENPFLPKPKPVDNVDDTPNEGQETYSTATKVLIGVGVVGAVGFGIKMLGMMQD